MTWYLMTEGQLKAKRIGELADMYRAHCRPPHHALLKAELVSAIYNEARLFREADDFIEKNPRLAAMARLAPRPAPPKTETRAAVSSRPAAAVTARAVAVGHCITAAEVNAWLATLPPTPFAGEVA